ncbi:hypothetical protein TcasGA2_TC016381 [Tribolium castaneum]|uniref:Uncharacterized protein n=1 Tax=Tribolium castaneum TaxID=7070 RepID=D6WPD5_TRICA|nr:hypothetical protein TcasGA2_TC016381 [Tribolium castaneum]
MESDLDFFPDYLNGYQFDDGEGEEVEEEEIKYHYIEILDAPRELLPPVELTLKDLSHIANELGLIKLCWPEIEHPEFENRVNFPESYLANSNKEKLLLLYTENFRRQFSYKYPHRKQLFLASNNECGMQKMVCNTIRLTTLPYPEIETWQDCAKFVGNALRFEPFEIPTLIDAKIVTKKKENWVDIKNRTRFPPIATIEINLQEVKEKGREIFIEYPTALNSEPSPGEVRGQEGGSRTPRRPRVDVQTTVGGPRTATYSPLPPPACLSTPNPTLRPDSRSRNTRDFALRTNKRVLMDSEKGAVLAVHGNITRNVCTKGAWVDIQHFRRDFNSVLFFTGENFRHFNFVIRGGFYNRQTNSYNNVFFKIDLQDKVVRRL